jgi:hypothetical protein
MQDKVIIMRSLKIAFATLATSVFVTATNAADSPIVGDQLRLDDGSILIVVEVKTRPSPLEPLVCLRKRDDQNAQFNCVSVYDVNGEWVSYGGITNIYDKYEKEHPAAQSVSVMVPAWDDVRDPLLPGNACGAGGEIKVNSFVSVRAGPGIRYRELDRVLNGRRLVLCDNPHRSWYPIVYVPGRDAYEDKKCFSGDLIKWKTWHQYRGPCRSGWVSKNFVGNVAG